MRADGQEPDLSHVTLGKLAKTAKSTPLKSAACKFGGCAPKISTSGDRSPQRRYGFDDGCSEFNRDHLVFEWRRDPDRPRQGS